MKKWLTTTLVCTATLLGGCATPSSHYSSYPVYGSRGGGEYRSQSYSGSNISQQAQITNVQQKTLIYNQQYNTRINVLNQRIQQQKRDLAAQAEQQQLQEMEALKQRHATQTEIAALRKHWRIREQEQETRLRQAQEQEMLQLRQEFAKSAQEQQQQQQQGQNIPVQPIPVQPTPVQNTESTQPDHDSVPVNQPVPIHRHRRPPMTSGRDASAPTPVTAPPGRDALFADHPAPRRPLQTQQVQPEAAPQPATQVSTPTPQQKRKKHRDSDDGASTSGN